MQSAHPTGSDIQESVMNDQRVFDASRRRALAIIGGLAAAAALPAGIAEAQTAKTTKEASQYQEGPKDGKRCQDCQFFEPGSGGTGTCKLVEGDISANGWCLLFAAKPQ
jgi:hypothetical protein